jgi:DNA-binding MarR family transcriptional regulator
MKANLESTELELRLWRQMYQTYTLLKKCEDQIFEQHRLTTEQYGILISIGYLGEPARVTDIARWLERSTNSISMIVDRMVKAGLVKRVRDKGDRREVHVFITSKGEQGLGPATRSSLEVVQKILSPLSHKDRLTLLNLLGTMKYEIIEYLNPGVDVEKIKRNELKQGANLKKWLSEYGLTSTPEAKRRGGKKGKTI